MLICVNLACIYADLSQPRYADMCCTTKEGQNKNKFLGLFRCIIFT